MRAHRTGTAPTLRPSRDIPPPPDPPSDRRTLGPLSPPPSTSTPPVDASSHPSHRNDGPAHALPTHHRAGSVPTASAAQAAARARFHELGSLSRQRYTADRTSTSTVLHGYVVELVFAGRYKSLDLAQRHAQATRVLLHHLRHLARSDGLLAGEPPPYLRRRHAASDSQSRKRFEPGAPTSRRVCLGGEGCSHEPLCTRATAAEAVERVPSRGRPRVRRARGFGGLGSDDDDDDDDDDDGRGESPASDLRLSRFRRTDGGSVDDDAAAHDLASLAYYYDL